MINIRFPSYTTIRENLVTVYPDDPFEMPQDFPCYSDAEEYADEHYGAGHYTIEFPYY